MASGSRKTPRKTPKTGDALPLETPDSFVERESQPSEKDGGRSPRSASNLRRLARSEYLTGQFLVAMPAMGDPQFERTVIYLCHHAAEGAMGLIVNKPLTDLKFPDVLEQLKIAPTEPCDRILVHRGGPVDRARGFVLHSTDYDNQGTLKVNDTIALSATTEILRAIASGHGPRHSLMALGYSGWGEGQLDNEIKQNAWLTVPADEDLLFSIDVEKKWERALAKLGISPALLSGAAGHA